MECDCVPECHSFHLADGTKDVMLPLPLEPLENNEGCQSNSHPKAPQVLLWVSRDNPWVLRQSLLEFLCLIFSQKTGVHKTSREVIGFSCSWWPWRDQVFCHCAESQHCCGSLKLYGPYHPPRLLCRGMEQGQWLLSPSLAALGCLHHSCPEFTRAVVKAALLACCLNPSPKESKSSLLACRVGQSEEIVTGTETAFSHPCLCYTSTSGPPKLLPPSASANRHHRSHQPISSARTTWVGSARTATYILDLAASFLRSLELTQKG